MSAPSDNAKFMAWWAWSLAVLFVVFLFSIQTSYAIVNASVKTELGISIEQVGLVAAAYTWVFAICQFFGGPLLDRTGAHRVMVPAIALVTLGAFVFAHAHSFAGLLLSQVILAVGACVGFVGAGYIGGKWFGMAKFSFMFGLVQFAASLFSAFNQNLIVWLLDHTTWRALFNGVGIFGIALFAVGYVWLRDPPSEKQEVASTPFITNILSNLKEVVCLPQVWLAAIVGACCFGSLLSLGVVWGPKLLQARGVAPEDTGTMASLFWLGLAVGCVLVPWCSDKFRMRKLPVLAGVAGQLLALGLLVYLPELNHAGIVALCLIFGFANAVHMLAFSIAGDIVPPRLIGTSAALVNGSMFLAAGVLMSRPGVRVEDALAGGQNTAAELVQSAMFPLLVALAAALLLSFFLRESFPRASQ